VRVRTDAELRHCQRRNLSTASAADRQQAAEATAGMAVTFVTVTWNQCYVFVNIFTIIINILLYRLYFCIGKNNIAEYDTKHSTKNNRRLSAKSSLSKKWLKSPKNGVHCVQTL
jgi:hypothetical protein